MGLRVGGAGLLDGVGVMQPGKVSQTKKQKNGRVRACPCGVTAGLMSCPCNKQWYCCTEHQREDRKIHKQVCSASKSKGGGKKKKKSQTTK